MNNKAKPSAVCGGLYFVLIPTIVNEQTANRCLFFSMQSNPIANLLTDEKILSVFIVYNEMLYPLKWKRKGDDYK